MYEKYQLVVSVVTIQNFDGSWIPRNSRIPGPGIPGIPTLRWDSVPVGVVP
jgi:hypothetical protein